MSTQRGSKITSIMERLGFHVKGNIQDLVAFLMLVPKRKYFLRRLSVQNIEEPYINILSDKLHPVIQNLKIAEIINETKTTRTYRLMADKAKGTQALAYFRAGQYISIKERINDHAVSRPYSIASSPQDALDGFYDITIKRLEGGFLTTHIWETWKAGYPVSASGPYGLMYHEPLRDSGTVVGLAGGSGITPFRSMVREMAAGKLNIKLKLIYGCSDGQDIIFFDELNKYAREMPDRFRIVYVFSGCLPRKDCPDPIEEGFITADIINRHSDPSKDSYFICGPAVMYDFVAGELEKLSIPRKRIRMEAYGEIKNPTLFKDYPYEAQGKTFTIKVHDGKDTITIPALASESVLVALERGKLSPPSVCRSGECQFCRTRLISGKIWVSPKNDGRRQADKLFGYMHPCASFPVSDLELALPLNTGRSCNKYSDTRSTPG
ncbi:MAG TPA: iron-sulfur cluster-binding domain-containing protein [Methanothrix sp.]|jgi:ferredoxin-NADP reductase|nr:iron-sulfur cluster-binding domain-containing protein [Methanothrix sp.]